MSDTPFDQAVAALAAAEAGFGQTRSAADLDRAKAAAQQALGAGGLPPGAAVDLLNLGARLLGLYGATDDDGVLTLLAACVDRMEPMQGQLPAAAVPNYLALRGDARFKQWSARYAGYPDAEIRGMTVLDDAIGSLTAAGEAIVKADPVAGRSRPLYLDVVGTLAAAARSKRRWLKVTPDLGPYAGLLRQALDQGGGDPASRAQCAWTLGRLLWDEYAETGTPLSLLEAVERLGSAVAQAPAADARRVSYELAHATAAAWLAREAGDSAGDTPAASLPALWARGLAVSPGATRDSARLWGDLQAREGNWAASADAYAAAASATLLLLRQRATAEERRLLLRANRGFFVHAAFALAQAGRLAEAVVMLERGRGVFFAGPDAVDPVAQDAAAAVAAALARLGHDHAAAFILSTWYGGAAIVLRDGHAPWLVDLPALTDDEVERRLARLMGAYKATYPPPDTVVTVTTADGPEEIRRWEPELDAVAGWSWDACMGPLLASLPGCQELTLIPVGTLPVLPLHAAWTADPPPAGAATVAGRRYAVDHLAVCYAPTLRACLAAQGRWAGLADGRVLGIDDPESAGVPALPGTRLEVEVLGELFDDVLVLHGKDATTAAVKGALPGASLLHFGCHGAADQLNPGNSRLLLHGADTLTLAEIGQLDLSRARVCVLSACESAMIGAELPDEVISLPTAFAQAGAGTVAGSLWSVPDLSTALLVRKFYRNLRAGDSPAQALRQAQRWLRDSTWAEQSAELPPDRRPGGDTLARSELGRQRPAQAIADWAAFVVTA